MQNNTKICKFIYNSVFCIRGSGEKKLFLIIFVAKILFFTQNFLKARIKQENLERKTVLEIKSKTIEATENNRKLSKLRINEKSFCIISPQLTSLSSTN